LWRRAFFGGTTIPFFESFALAAPFVLFGGLVNVFQRALGFVGAQQLDRGGGDFMWCIPHRHQFIEQGALIGQHVTFDLRHKLRFKLLIAAA
jgi:hypothetical protein